jgi:hypothetical protein
MSQRSLWIVCLLLLTILLHPIRPRGSSGQTSTAGGEKAMAASAERGAHMQILAATDFSTRSNRALRQAGLLAQHTEAELHVLHVVDDDQPDELVRMEKRSRSERCVGCIGSAHPHAFGLVATAARGVFRLLAMAARHLSGGRRPFSAH